MILFAALKASRFRPARTWRIPPEHCHQHVQACPGLSTTDRGYFAQALRRAFRQTGGPAATPEPVSGSQRTLLTLISGQHGSGWPPVYNQLRIPPNISWIVRNTDSIIRKPDTPHKIKPKTIPAKASIMVSDSSPERLLCAGAIGRPI